MFKTSYDSFDTLELQSEVNCIALLDLFLCVHSILKKVVAQPYSMHTANSHTVHCILSKIWSCAVPNTVLLEQIWMISGWVSGIKSVLICFRKRFHLSPFFPLFSKVVNCVFFYLYGWESVFKKERKHYPFPRTTSSVSDYNSADENNDRKR